MLQPNEIFAERYLLIKLVGRGGFAEVWLAEDIKTHINIALKIYAPGTGLDSDGVELFKSEFTRVYDLHHQNLLCPSYYDDENGMPYLVLPYCERGSLAKQTGMREIDVWRVIRDVASGLAYLHNSSPAVVHQDIKPENILVNGNGDFLISDFGISSKIRRTLSKSVAKQESSGGTFEFMGPERFGSDPFPVKASDIWSLGAMIFELVEGYLPFGDHGGISQKNGADIPETKAHITEELKTLIFKCLSKETWDRPMATQISEYATRKCVDVGTPTPEWLIMKEEVGGGAGAGDGETAEKLKRHWFVTSWIVLIVALNSCFVIFLAHPDYGFILGACTSLVCAVSGMALWFRKKWGYWTMCLANAVLIIYDNVNSNIFYTLIGMVLGFGLLRLILGIKKGGVSFWSQMDNRFTKKSSLYIFGLGGVLALILLLLIVFNNKSRYEYYSPSTVELLDESESVVNEEVRVVEKVAEVPVEEPVKKSVTNSSAYKRVVADDGSCAIYIPKNYFPYKLMDDQLMAFLKSETEPFFVVLREEKTDFDNTAVTSLESYSELIRNLDTANDDLENLVVKGFKETTTNRRKCYEYSFTADIGEYSAYYYKYMYESEKYYYQINIYYIGSYSSKNDKIIKDAISTIEILK